MSVEITFGELVKKYRKKSGLTQKELAHRVNCAPVTLRKIEYDDLRPSVQIAKALAEAFEISSEKLSAFVRVARGEHTTLDVSALSLEETDTDKWLSTHESVSAAELTADDNPYKGLRAFDESDTADFFGREALIQQLLLRLKEGGDLARFLAVVGPSGSGKSSVVKAGVLPALKRGALPNSENWLIAELVPGSNPLQELEVALLERAGNPQLSLMEELEKDMLGLLRAVDLCLPNDPVVDLLLVIDQFEELFTLVHDEKFRSHFLDILLTAVLDESSRVHIIITLRADFIDRLLNYADFSELISQRIEFILPLTEDEMERAIVGPANRVGLKMDAGIVSDIIHDLGDQPGTLPLLQYSLTELFDKREGNIITKVSYQSIGGALGALGRRAEHVFLGLGITSQSTARQLFLRLVTLGEGVEDTRRRVLRTELDSLVKQEGRNNPSGSKEMQLVLDSFGKSRLLTFDRDPLTGSPTVEIAHEVLIRAWKRLREWLVDGREDLHIQRQIMLAAREWISGKQDPSFLATGARLVRFESLAKESNLALNDQERAYLNASIAERQQREAKRTARRRRTLYLQRLAIGILAFLFLAAVWTSIFAFNQRNEARVQERIAFSRQLAAQALAEVEKPIGNDEFAALLAIRSLNLQYDPIADAALVQAAGKLPIREFSGHNDEIRSVAYSPDGKYVLTGSVDTTVKLWEAATGKEIYTLQGHTGEITDVAFSPNSLYALTGSTDHTARLWNISTGQEVFTLKGHADEVLSVAFSPDGNYILTTVWGDNRAKLWEVATGREVHSFNPSGLGNGASFSPDGKYVLAASGETAELWEVSTGQEIFSLSGHSNEIYGTAFSPDGKYMLTGSIDNTAILWDFSTGQEIYTIRGHSSSVRSVAFSPDGKYILTGSGDRTARLWDVATGMEVRSWRGHFGRVWSAVFSSDGKYILTGSADGKAKLWNFAIAEEYTVRGHNDEVFGAAFSPDGKQILTSSLDLTAKIWDASTRQELRTLSGHIETINRVNFSPDGKYAVTAGEDGATKLWDVATGEELHSFNHDRVRDAVFSPDGKYILTASRDGTAILWEVATGQQVQVFTGHNTEVLSVSFSPDGKYILTGSADLTAKIWDLTTGKVVHTLSAHTDSVFGTAFSPDGKYALTSSVDTTAKLWDVVTGKEIRTLNGHTNSVYDVSFAPDGKYALTASADRTAKIWDIPTGMEVRTLSGHTSAIWSAVFSPDGKQVLTSSFDRTARLWEVDYRDFVKAVCSQLLRDFTEEERVEAHIEDQEPSCT